MVLPPRSYLAVLIAGKEALVDRSSAGGQQKRRNSERKAGRNNPQCLISLLVKLGYLFSLVVQEGVQ